MKVAIYIVLALFVAPVACGQTVSGISGTVAAGQSITISGSSFGSSGPTVVLFDDFENGSDNTQVPTAANYGSWSSTDAGFYCIDDHYVSGSLSSSADYSSATSNDAFKTFTETDEVFFSTWYLIPSGTVLPGTGNEYGINWKPFWIYDDGTVDDDLTLPHASGSSWMIFKNDGPQPRAYYITSGLSFEIGQWQRTSWYAKGGYSSDGAICLWRLNDTDAMYKVFDQSELDLWDDDGDGQNRWRRLEYNAYGRSTDNCTPAYDDVYLATGEGCRARVEIGNASIYTSCTNMTILRPTAWSATEITAVVNQGSFAEDDAAYLFVVDADGNVSDGYAVTIGSSESASITAPTSLTANKVE